MFQPLMFSDCSKSGPLSSASPFRGCRSARREWRCLAARHSRSMSSPSTKMAKHECLPATASEAHWVAVQAPSRTVMENWNVGCVLLRVSRRLYEKPYRRFDLGDSRSRAGRCSAVWHARHDEHERDYGHGRHDGRWREHDGNERRRDCLDAAGRRRRGGPDRRSRPWCEQNLKGCNARRVLRLTDRAMIRAVALTVALTLAGTPVAMAACIVWCSSPCPTSMPNSATGVTAPRTCADTLVTGPGLREDSLREASTHPVTHVALNTPRAFIADLQSGRVTRNR